MLSPVKDRQLTSPFGDRIHPVTGERKLHNGADYVSSTDQGVYAPEGGTVTAVYSNSTGGNQIIIDHGFKVTSGYAHLSAVYVAQGDTVKAGQKIGQIGATGAVTGAHLHYTLKQGEKYLDPENNIVGITDMYLFIAAGIFTMAAIIIYKTIR